MSAPPLVARVDPPALARPGEAPVIRANYLTTDLDWRCALAGVRFAQELANSESLKDCTETPYRPGPEATTDENLKEFCRNYGMTIFHPSGTCKMGTDPAAVVNPQLRVRGVDGLRIVDCSIMPTLISGNTNAPVAIIAEKASDMILEAAKAGGAASALA